MKALIVGCGESGALWPSIDDGSFDVVGQLNGAVKNNGWYTHLFCVDSRNPSQDWWEYGVLNAKKEIITRGGKSEAAVHQVLLTKESGTPIVHGFQLCNDMNIFPLAPGVKSDMRLFCRGTVLHCALHYFIHLPGIEEIQLLGVEHQLTSTGGYHFYSSAQHHSIRSTVSYFARIVNNSQQLLNRIREHPNFQHIRLIIREECKGRLQ